MYFKISFLFLISVFLFTGCSFKYSDDYTDISNEDYKFQSASLQNTLHQRYIKMLKNKRYKMNKKDIDFESLEQANLNEGLFDFYKDWKGVRYRYGGTSKDGIDCSAFIQKAYEESFDISLPRTTTLQANLGMEIDKSELELGDLVFFKTEENTNHVGIYIENGNFMHASTKVGVTISQLDNEYFDRHYWKAQRLIY